MPTQEERNIAVVLKMVDIVNEQRLDELDDLFDPNFIEHNGLGPMPPGLAGVKLTEGRYHEAMPDIHFEITDVVAEGDKVVASGIITGTHKGEVFGIKPLGRKITWTGTEICYLKDGKITERWLCADTLGMFRQMQGFEREPRVQLI